MSQDWDELEALRASLREHMAEIHRLRVAGQQALEALREIDSPLLVREITRIGSAMSGLRAVFEPVTDCHEKEGDKLSLPLESKNLSEESLNELVAQLKAATADRDARIKPTHMVFTGDSLDYLKKLADERNADTGKTSDVPETNFGNMAQSVDSKEDDHIPNAAKMMASVRESRTVEPVAWMIYTLDGQSAFITDNPADFTPEHTALPLYTAPPKRKPLTDAEIKTIYDALPKRYTLAMFARAVERAHGIGGEE